MKDKAIIGIVSKNLVVKEFYNWSWQRINEAVRSVVCKNGALVMGILPQTIEVTKSSANSCKDLNDQEKEDILKCVMALYCKEE